MATILQCKFCGKPFQSLGVKVCPDCLEEIDEDYKTIKDYMYDNPGSFDIGKLCEETGIKKKKVLYLIEEKRLVLKQPDGQGIFSCSVCRKPIHEGTMCEECRETLSKKLRDTLPKADDKSKTVKPTGVKMHTSSRSSKKKY